MRARRGANVVEFALLAPVLVALLAGIMDFSWMFLMREAASSSAHAAARAGAFGADDTTARAAATARWASIGLPGTPTTTLSRTGTPPMMVADVTIDAHALVGFTVGDTHIEVTAVKRMGPTP